MAEIEELQGLLTEELDKLEREVKSFSKKEFAQKQTTIKKCDHICKNIRNLQESYDLEINGVDKATASLYSDVYKEICSRFKKLSQELEFKKAEGLSQNTLFDGRKQVPAESRQEVIQVGKETQKKGFDALDNIQGMVVKGNEIANSVLVELDRQIESLDRMHDTLKDTQSVIKRSQKLIRYFARQLYTDKIIMGLICLIIVAILVIVILSMMGKDSAGRFNVPKDVVK